MRNGCPPPPSSLLSEQPPIQVRVTLFLADFLMFFRGLTLDSTLIPARHSRFFFFFSARLGSREMMLPRPPARCTRYKLPLLSHPLPIITIFPGRRTLASQFTENIFTQKWKQKKEKTTPPPPPAFRQSCHERYDRRDRLSHKHTIFPLFFGGRKRALDFCFEQGRGRMRQGKGERKKTNSAKGG